MQLTPLTATTPIDGRYFGKTNSLSQFFSEFALIRYRITVEIEYFIALCELPLPNLQNFNKQLYPNLRSIYTDLTEQQAQRVKDIEAITNHDVKAVEYYIKEQFDVLGLQPYKEFIHFGLTSQDINNTSLPMMIRDAYHQVLLPLITELTTKLSHMQQQWADVPMLAKTHGQPASPTRLGKEIGVFVYRLHEQITALSRVPFTGKFGGATGNFNAHRVAYPNIDWLAFAENFLATSLGIQREQLTTQISNYDHLAAFFDGLKRICTIVEDLDRDIWLYISMNYFKQKIKAGEVGSSAMPHKVNPIDFENSEGNLGLAVALFDFLSHKLPISRLQRDLTDSTVTRNVGVPLAHMVIALSSTIKGLGKLILNEEAIHDDLDQMWNVVAEALQTILRREGYPNPYETLKQLTRTNATVDQQTIHQFIDTLDLPEAVKQEMRRITPHNYLGY